MGSTSSHVACICRLHDSVRLQCMEIKKIDIIAIIVIIAIGAAVVFFGSLVTSESERCSNGNLVY